MVSHSSYMQARANRYQEYTYKLERRVKELEAEIKGEDALPTMPLYLITMRRAEQAEDELQLLKSAYFDLRRENLELKAQLRANHEKRMQECTTSQGEFIPPRIKIKKIKKGERGPTGDGEREC